MMIRNFSDGDVVTSGSQLFVDQHEAVRQGIYARLRLFFGEYFLDAADGTPWFQGILGKSPQDIAEANLKQRIISAPGVAELSEFSFSFDQNQRRFIIVAAVSDYNGDNIQISLDQELF